MDRHGNVKFVDVVNGKRDWKCASVVDATHLSVLYCSCLFVVCCLVSICCEFHACLEACVTFPKNL